MAIPTTDSVQGQGVRTLNAGDVVAKICDATTTSQQLGIDSTGRITIKLDDGAGNIITSQVNGTQRALDVGINVAGVQVDPRAIRALTSADVVSVVQSTSPWIVKDQSDGPVAPGAAASFSMLAGGVYTSGGITLTTGQQSALQLNSAGQLIIRPLTSADVVTSNQGSANTIANAWPFKLTDGTNTQAVKAASTAAAATDPAAVVALSPNTPLPAGTNALGSVLANMQVAGAPVTQTNPVPVILSNSLPGTPVNSYFMSTTNLAYGSSDTHLYTITTGKTLTIKKIWVGASGRVRFDVQVSTNGSTFVTVLTGYTSTSYPNAPVDFDEYAITDSGTGAAVQIVRYNEELGQTFGVASSIFGNEN